MVDSLCRKGEALSAASFRIGNREIGADQPVFVVAEIGANHDGSIDKACALVDMAHAAGADAVKLQTYSADELVADPERVITWGPPGSERTEAVGAMFDRLALPRSDHAQVFEHAKHLGLTAFSTPFSLDALHFLDGLGVPCWKFASSDVNYHALLQAGARTGKPVILSIGKSLLSEAAAAVEALEEAGVNGLGLLHCLAQYPAPDSDINLRVIPMLSAAFPDVVVGYSDHTVGTAVSTAAVALGARIVEKHITLDKRADGPDHWFSSDGDELTHLIAAIRQVDLALGGSRKKIAPSEALERRNATRSLAMALDLPKGARIGMADIKVVRPGWGIPPYRMADVVGLTLARSAAKNEILTWQHFHPAE